MGRFRIIGTAPLLYRKGKKLVNTNVQAVAKSLTINSGYKGLCLVFVRTCYGINAKYPSAAEAWKNAKNKHVTQSLADAPVGAPVFFSVPGNKYGHVAIYLGGGNFRTNYSARGTVITAKLGDPVFRTMKMLGWTEDLNGVDIKFVDEPKPSTKYVTIKRGDNLSTIASKNKITLKKLMSLNPNIKNANLIYPGDKVRVK